MRKIGCLFHIIGILLLSVSVLLCCYNIWDTKRANEAAAEALEVLVSNNPQIFTELRDEEINTVLDNNEMGTASEIPEQVPAKQETHVSIEVEKEEEIPDFQLNPAMDMPVQEVDGQQYIGIINLEDISISLPVISDWDYEKLKLAPCRYSGSAYQAGFVIMAHNFVGHFGNLDDLTYGSFVTFTDMDGNVFKYQVTDIEVLEHTDVEYMKNDAWDLTLFTCTLSGTSRVTIRCVKV